MTTMSINNGLDETTIAQLTDKQCAEMAGHVELMDDEIREAVHVALAPCSPREFLAEYARRHLDRFGELFTVG
jgi:hypothetical protein